MKIIVPNQLGQKLYLCRRASRWLIMSARTGTRYTQKIYINTDLRFRRRNLDFHDVNANRKTIASPWLHHGLPFLDPVPTAQNAQAIAARGFLPLRRNSIQVPISNKQADQQSKVEDAPAVYVVLLLDMPQDKWKRRIRHQHRRWTGDPRIPQRRRKIENLPSQCRLQIQAQKEVPSFQTPFSVNVGLTFSGNQRHFCPECGSHLYCLSEEWPQWIYPYASCIDTPLPKPKHVVHMLLDSKASWVVPQKEGKHYQHFPPLGIEEWHKKEDVFLGSDEEGEGEGEEKEKPVTKKQKTTPRKWMYKGVNMDEQFGGCDIYTYWIGGVIIAVEEICSAASCLSQGITVSWSWRLL